MAKEEKRFSRYHHAASLYDLMMATVKEQLLRIRARIVGTLSDVMGLKPTIHPRPKEATLYNRRARESYKK